DTPNLITCIGKLFGAKYRLIVSERNTNNGVLSVRQKLKYLLFRFADVIVPNSNSQESFLLENFPSLSQKVHTITNFVETDLFLPVSNRKFNAKRRIICAGRI